MTPLLAALAVATAATSFDPVPEGNGLQMRIVRYEGSTNGGMTVEVKNPTGTALTLAPQGLYFVPQVDPEHAPQRLGAVGPMRMHQGDERRETLELAPGASATMTLDVYCIDSHRSSPSSDTPFRVAKTRMPRELARALDANTKAKAAQSGSPVYAAPAKSAVQSEVWRTRDAKWIKLDGESTQEATK
jgi:hypothetical protein